MVAAIEIDAYQDRKREDRYLGKNEEEHASHFLAIQFSEANVPMIAEFEAGPTLGR